MAEKITSIWIGLVKVEVLNGSNILGSDKMAYTNAVGAAISKYQFRNHIKVKLHSLGLRLIRLESAELFSDRSKSYTVHNNIIESIKRLSGANNVEFSALHTYPEN